jgi:hypothetical protein
MEEIRDSSFIQLHGTESVLVEYVEEEDIVRMMIQQTG